MADKFALKQSGNSYCVQTVEGLHVTSGICDGNHNIVAGGGGGSSFGRSTTGYGDGAGANQGAGGSTVTTSGAGFSRVAPKEPQFIVMVGDPGSGFHFHGPYDKEAAYERYAEMNKDLERIKAIWIAPLED